MTGFTVGPILAIDLGKYKSVAWFYDGGSSEVAFRPLGSRRDEQLMRPLPTPTCSISVT